jgi:hypothetical protein
LNALTARSSPGTQAQNTTFVHELAAAVRVKVLAEAAPPPTMERASAPAMAAAAPLLNVVGTFLDGISIVPFFLDYLGYKHVFGHQTETILANMFGHCRF